MLVALECYERERIAASDVLDHEYDVDDFVCPGCGGNVILKKGRIRIPHFAHAPGADCPYGAGEGELHMSAKTQIYEALKESDRVKNVEMERILGKVRPDISGRLDGHPFAIEIQVSDLSVDKIIQRTQAYADLGISILWTVPFAERLQRNRVAPRDWQRWLGALGYGRVYYWLMGSLFLPVHFGPHWLWKEASEWYDEEGQYREAGGYYRRSKRYRTPMAGSSVDLLRDFSPRVRDEWKGEGGMHVPACTVLVDRQKRWWEKNPSPPVVDMCAA